MCRREFVFVVVVVDTKPKRNLFSEMNGKTKNIVKKLSMISLYAVKSVTLSIAESCLTETKSMVQVKRISYS